MPQCSPSLTPHTATDFIYLFLAGSGTPLVPYHVLKLYITIHNIYIYITCVLALYPYWISQLLNTDFHLMNGPKLLSLKKFTQTRF